MKQENKIYTYFPDINGNFLVTNFNVTNPNVESDYAWVYFTLDCKENPSREKIYISMACLIIMPFQMRIKWIIIVQPIDLKKPY